MMTDPDVDLAGHAYWEDVWERTGRHRVGQFAYFHYALSRIFDRYTTKGCQVCEVGCADSAWIPYFLERGMRVSGIDYSTKGVARLQTTLARRGLHANLTATNVLDPSFQPSPIHDLVFSLGLVEHFRDPGAILGPMHGLLKKGGVLLTLVPNLIGVWGFVQSKLDPEILALHVRYSPPDIDQVHIRAGFYPVEAARYFGTFGPLMLNAPAIARRLPRVYQITTGCVWLLEQGFAWPLGLSLGRHSESRLFSSHIIGVYKKQ
jgi:SAM-dependent methyltransferase